VRVVAFTVTHQSNEVAWLSAVMPTIPATPPTDGSHFLYGLLFTKEDLVTDAYQTESMFSPGDSPAKTSAWLENVQDWTENDPDSGTNSNVLLVTSLPHGFSWRTSLDFCLRTPDGILAPLSGRWANSGIGGPSGSLTLNTSEWPNDAAVCSLSDVVERVAPARFSLSRKACQGILRRAEKKGKQIPSPLLSALLTVANGEDRTETK